MMPDTLKQASHKAQEDAQVALYGWVRTKRSSKNLAFLALNDGSMQENIQVVIEAANPCFEKLAQIQTGASVKVDGLWKKSLGKGQQWEVLLKDLEVLGKRPLATRFKRKATPLSS